MNDIQLAVAHPPLVGNIIHANPLSIILGRPQHEVLLHNYYLQMYCNGSDSYEKIVFDFHTPFLNDFSQFPLLDARPFDRKRFGESGDSFVRFAVSELQQGRYVSTFLEEGVVENSILIYGYDEASGIFRIGGFNALKVYSFRTMEAAVLGRAFEQFKSAHDWMSPVYTFRLTEEEAGELDFVRIYEQLNHYVQGRLGDKAGSEEPYRYGIRVYDYFAGYLQALAEDRAEYCIRPMQVLWEHKQCMLNRVKALIEHGVVGISDEPFREISETVFLLRNLMLKYNMTLKKDYLHKIIQSLNVVKDTEINVIDRLLTQMYPLTIDKAGISR